MNKFVILTIILSVNTILSFGQNLADLKLTDKEMPEGYTRSKKLQCKSIQAALLYEQIDLYTPILGQVKAKDFQTFKSKNDQGSILYFEFENNVKLAEFLSGLLWGESDKPTKFHPEEFHVKKNLLIVWSFDEKSAVKTASKEKLANLL